MGKSTSEEGIVERRFDLNHAGGTIPGILWTPSRHVFPLPLVLIGHGGSGHKRSERQLVIAHHLVKTSRVAVAAIDGPFHGERLTAPLMPYEYLEKMNAMGVDQVANDMVRDWLLTLEAISGLVFINADHVAYMGFSMGTRFGIPFAAAAGSRLRCVVLGKNGMQARAELNMAARFKTDAPKVKIPVLFHMQSGDEIFPRDGQLELFNLIQSADKRLITFPGSHAITDPEAIDAWCGFIREHLVP
jgi:dienelactone hydrolase